MIEWLLQKIRQFPTQLFIIIIGALLFIPFLGQVHLFDWDEINFAESAREMLLTHNFHIVQINFEPFFEKPPLFIWLQALSMHYLGVNEFAARLPDAVCGVITMLVVFNVGRQVFSSQLGVLWALLFACSILPQIYFKSGIIDPIFNLFIFLGTFFLFKLSEFSEFENSKTRASGRRRHLVLSAVFIGLATLTKGPVAILIISLTALAYLIANRGKMQSGLVEMLVWWLIVFAMVLLWLSLSSKQFGFKFISEFIKYQVRLFSTEDAGHGGPFYYHFIILLIGVFPASALIFGAFKKNDYDDAEQVAFKKWMICLMLVVLILFSIVRTKIVHYSSLTYFPITFLAAYYLNYFLDGKMTWTWRQTLPLTAICLLITGALTAGIFLIVRPSLISYYVKDDFAKGCLQARVLWSEADIRFGIAYLVLIITASVLIQIKQHRLGVYIIIISSALFVNKMLSFVVPRVEKYSQAALIEFLASKKDENCLIETAGFKSYAHYFYAGLKPPDNNTGKPHYVITKINKIAEAHNANPRLVELYRKNGWVFFKEE